MRIPIFLTPISCALALALSLPAMAQSPGSDSTPQAAPGQSAPAQSHSAQPPAAQQNAPADNNQNRAQSQVNDDNPLNLTDEQKAKLRPIITEENQQMEAVRNDTKMTQDQKIAKANQIRAEASPKIKAVLTPEQLQKLSELQQERARQQQQESQPSPSSSAPSGSNPGNSQTPSNSQPPSGAQVPPK